MDDRLVCQLAAHPQGESHPANRAALTRQGTAQLRAYTTSTLVPDTRQLIMPNNSCYMFSVIQVLFTLPPLQQRHAATLTVQHWTGCTEPFPTSCIDCTRRASRLASHSALTATRSGISGTRKKGRSAAESSSDWVFLGRGNIPKAIRGRHHIKS